MIRKRNLIWLLATGAGLALALPADAQVIHAHARVLAVHPVYEDVVYRVPVEHCRLEYRPTAPHSYTAPIAGAVIGGAIGNAVGHHKRNKQVGAVVGALLGGSIGADIARRHASQSYRDYEVCDVAYDERREARLLGYDVTYRYAGSDFTTRMDHRPGAHIPVRVHVAPAV